MKQKYFFILSMYVYTKHLKDPWPSLNHYCIPQMLTAKHANNLIGNYIFVYYILCPSSDLYVL